MKIVKIIWKDARTLDSTNSLEEVKKENLIDSITIGYLIDENKERIVVCGFVFPEEEGDYNGLDFEKKEYTGYRECHLIPIKQIEEIIELKEEKNARM